MSDKPIHRVKRDNEGLVTEWDVRDEGDGTFSFCGTDGRAAHNEWHGPFPLDDFYNMFVGTCPISRPFVACKDPNEYDVCDECKARLRQFAYVIEGQSDEDRPYPTEDDHYNAVEGAAEFCGGDKCDNPPSEAIDQETTYCCICEQDLAHRSAGFVCDNCGRLYCNYHADDEMRETDVCPNCRGEE